jgi:hypothetical protein
MNYNINIGSHAATVNLTEDGKGGFTGVVSHTQYGAGKVSGTYTPGAFTGTVNLDGHNADFSATVSGANISGVITPTGFLAMIAGPASFTGTETA